MLFASSEADLLRILRQFSEILRKRRLIISSLSFTFRSSLEVDESVRRKVSIPRLPVKNISDLSGCERPRLAGDFCKYVQGINWVSSSIPRFAKKISVLRELLEKSHANAGGRRKKKSIAMIPPVDLRWKVMHWKPFNDLQTQFQEAHTSRSKIHSVHKHWRLRWAFDGWHHAARPWSAFQTARCSFVPPPCIPKLNVLRTWEVLVHIQTGGLCHLPGFCQLDYLLSWYENTRAFTDHRSLLFVFNPVSMELSLGRHKALNVIRCALVLSAFIYRIEYVSNDSNIWPNIRTRWKREYRKPSRIRRVAPVIFL